MTAIAVQPRELMLLEQSKRLLAECKTIDEVKRIRDQAQAMLAYVQQQGDCLGIQNQAAEIKVRAERRIGEMLAEMPRHRREDGRPSEVSHHATLSDLGVGRDQSSRWQAVAWLPEDIFESHIESVKGEKELTTAGLLKLAKSLKARQTTTPNPQDDAPGLGVVTDLASLAGQNFATIYADPPWRYGNQGTRAATGNHYDTMTVEQICAEPVAALVAENAHLHLWTTNAFLFDARLVMEAWGFTYKSCFVWVKPQMGIGNYWRVSHEFLLFGVRGKAPFGARNERSWAELPRGKHSAKPDEIRDKIEAVSRGPYLEMYGRRAVPGSKWTVYGNQVSMRVC